jgi:hypothetical protein
MSSYISIVLKGVEFRIRHSHKIELQRDLNMHNIEIAKKKGRVNADDGQARTDDGRIAGR